MSLDVYLRTDRPYLVKRGSGSQLITTLRVGLKLMKADPSRFEKWNPANGWGSYEMFVPWIEKYLAACEAYPDAKVEVSR